jgi:hypothetical protein
MTASAYRIRLVGEVVGIFERGSERIAKVCLPAHCIEINVHEQKVPHLGDGMVIDASLSVENVAMTNDVAGRSRQPDERDSIGSS